MDSIVMLEGPDTRAAEIEVFRTEFLRWAAMENLSQPCPVGKLTTSCYGTKSRQFVWEVIADAMSDKDEFTRRAVEILCRLASGQFYDRNAAESLLSDMAEHWAELRCDL